MQMLNASSTFQQWKGKTQHWNEWLDRATASVSANAIRSGLVPTK